jgi:NAD+ synthase (glutamine-hydrolysing)
VPVAPDGAADQNPAMRTLRIGLAQLNPTVGDLEGNFARIVAAIERARAAGVEVLALPELVVTGYPPEDLLLKPAFVARAMERTRALAPHSAGMTVLAGTVERDGELFDAAAILHDGAWTGVYRKHLLPNYGVFDEKRWFAPGADNLVIERGPAILAVSVCEDIWFAGDPIEAQARAGAEVLVNLSASPYHAGKVEERRRMLAGRAIANRAIVAYVNLVGGQDEVLHDGASLVLGPDGRVLAEGARFAEDLVVLDLDLGTVEAARRAAPLRAPSAGEAPRRLALAPPSGTTPRPALAPRPIVAAPTADEEIYDALVLGTRDYVRKNGFETVVLGLSGGIDSALCACVAHDALGPEHVVGVSMPGPFSAGASREDAEALCQSLGLRFMVLPIQEPYAAFESTLAPAFAGREPDITEENLQARVRGTLLMSLSNKFGWLVLTTGNKSETSVGYSTLYGDSAGGFAVLKDVYKTAVYRLARLRNARGRVIPERTLTRPPSAELRPDQTDQDSLPPYDVLDPILELYVEDDRSIAEIVAAGFDEPTVRRVACLVDTSEYKRRQSPPGVKITPRAFGRDRRLPITNRWRG